VGGEAAAVDIGAGLPGQTAVVADYDRRIAQIDGAVENLPPRAEPALLCSLPLTGANRRAELVAQRDQVPRSLPSSSREGEVRWRAQDRRCGPGPRPVHGNVDRRRQ
jgi:hypothetical protein